MEARFSEDWAQTLIREVLPPNLHKCQPGFPFLSSCNVASKGLQTSPVIASTDPSSPCQVKLSSSPGLWNKRYSGRFQNDEITSDFITDAVMSVSSLTSLGEVNDRVSDYQILSAFQQTGAS